MLFRFIISFILFAVFSSSGHCQLDPLHQTIVEDLNERIALGYNRRPVAAQIDPDCIDLILPNRESHPSDQYQIASITKLFTAHLALILDELGIVDLEEPVGNLLTQTFPNVNKELVNKTLYEFLTHRTGLIDPGEGDYYNPMNQNTVPLADMTLEEVDIYLHAHPLADPQNCVRYSNLGYGLVSCILENATQKSFSSLLTEYIFQPFEMRKTFVGMPSNIVLGHCQGEPVAHWDTTLLPGYASLSSNLMDLTNYFQKLLFSDYKNTDVAQRMLQTPFHISGCNVQCGLGWTLDCRHDGAIFGVSGRSLGTHSYVGYDPKSSRIIILLADSHTIGNLAYRWLNPHFPKDLLYPKKEFDLEQMCRLEGVYAPCDGLDSNFEVVAKTDHIELVYENQFKTILYPCGMNQFFSKEFYDTSLITFREDKGVSGIYVKINQDELLLATKMGPS